MYPQWQPNPSYVNQPVQAWQLEDAHHAVRLGEKRLADAEHAYARETEQLHTTIAAYEHSATARDSLVKDLRSQLKTLKQDLSGARSEYEVSIAETEKQIAEISLEYAAETKRMREVVSDHQRTAAQREAARNELTVALAKSEATANELRQQNQELLARVDEKTKALANVDVTAKSRLEAAEQTLAEKQIDIDRVRSQLDETETQHRADVESLRQNVADLELAASTQDQTIQDLDRLCDQRAAEYTEAIELAQMSDRVLASEKENHLAEIELFQEELNSKNDTIAKQQAEAESLLHELEAKQAELDEVAQMSVSIDSQLNDAVSAHTEQIAKFEAVMAQNEEVVSARKTELRSLAMRTYRRETQFKQIVADLRQEAQTTLHEAICKHDSEVLRLSEVIASLEETGSDRESLIHELKQQIHQAQLEHQQTIASQQQNAAVALQQLRGEFELQTQQLQTELQVVTTQLHSAEAELSRTHVQLQTTSQDQTIHSQNAAELATRASELESELAQAAQSHEQAMQQSQELIEQYGQQFQDASQNNESLNQQLLQTQQENQLLQSDLHAVRSESDSQTQRADHLRKKIRQVIAAYRKTKTNPETLIRFRQHVAELKRGHAEEAHLRQRSDFTITQLNRTIAWMEHSAEELQVTLQREAAARRKAESVLKQLTEDEGENQRTDLPSVARSAALQIELEEKINRLTRELDATKKIRVIERKQFQAAVKRLTEQIGPSAQPTIAKRAA